MKLKKINWQEINEATQKNFSLGVAGTENEIEEIKKQQKEKKNYKVLINILNYSKQSQPRRQKDRQHSYWNSFAIYLPFQSFNNITAIYALIINDFELINLLNESELMKLLTIFFSTCPSSKSLIFLIIF